MQEKNKIPASMRADFLDLKTRIVKLRPDQMAGVRHWLVDLLALTQIRQEELDNDTR